MAREEPHITPLSPVLCPSCRGTSQEFHARRATTKQSLQVCRGPLLAKRLLVYLPPISIAWVCSCIPGSPGCSLPARPVRAQVTKLKGAVCQLSSWGSKSAWCYCCRWRDVTLHRRRVQTVGWEPSSGDAQRGRAAFLAQGDFEEELSPGAPNPLLQEPSLSTGPGNITGKPPSPAYVSC